MCRGEGGLGGLAGLAWLGPVWSELVRRGQADSVWLGLAVRCGLERSFWARRVGQQRTVRWGEVLGGEDGLARQVGRG